MHATARRHLSIIPRGGLSKRALMKSKAVTQRGKLSVKMTKHPGVVMRTHNLNPLEGGGRRIVRNSR